MKLAEINEYIQKTCENISKLLNVEVTLVDVNLVRIAGTGNFEQKIGTSIDQNSIYSHVLKSGQCYIMDEKYASEKCKTCNQRDYCKEIADICCPIIMNDKILGVIGLVAFNEDQRDIMLSKKDELMTFISSIAELMSLKLEGSSKKLKNQNKEIRPFEELEKEEIMKALKKYGNSTEGMKKIADALNIGIATLYRKVKKYNIKE
ncbi:GAF domain-containing protein [Tepidibacter formicigenes]|uniref:GAF domain-containing protein n=1 Tax=Tepidibacter formicigenes DSM 15518 TaxID=1123349 RepID=A0A1M6L599_9FIRM|nr:helix-turn-helix domain-containing protein [Tepidibacter formicigenes]SHJ66304.1 GAF domain-containing protein [Tepidibacter formicigenes DSM 15518]